jgi:hypothetical protein
MTYANGLFVVVGDSGTILTSPDGVTWTSRISNTPNNLTAVIYANGAFFTNSANLVSSDGINWINHQTTSVSGIGLIFNNGVIISVGNVINVLSLIFDFGKYDPNVNRYTFSDSVYQLND